MDDSAKQFVTFNELCRQNGAIDERLVESILMHGNYGMGTGKQFRMREDTCSQEAMVSYVLNYISIGCRQLMTDLEAKLAFENAGESWDPCEIVDIIHKMLEKTAEVLGMLLNILKRVDERRYSGLENIVVGMMRQRKEFIHACVAPWFYSGDVKQSLTGLLSRKQCQALNKLDEGDASYMQQLKHVFEMLANLGFRDSVQPICTRGLHMYLKEYCSSVEGDITVSLLESTLEHVESKREYLSGMIEQKEYLYYVHHVVQEVRLKALFDLVIDYPESMPALRDLKDCIRNTRAFRQLIEDFGRTICTRLLHPGASTADILQHYVTTIKVLDFIEPSGFVLEAVSAPIKKYLRSRKDAIKCIVGLLTEDSDDDGSISLLYDLEEASRAKKTGNNLSDEEALEEIENWEPSPLEIADSRFGYGKKRDALGLLTEIYGTKEMFIGAYKSMLAERLVQKKDYDCSKELKTLELLKIRFGESALHGPEVMLRDVVDSKRLHGSIMSLPNTSSPLKKHKNLVPIDALRVLVISDQFWPSVPTIEFTLPQNIENMLRTYEKKFHALKAPRILNWKHDVGSVSLALTVGNEKVDFDVSPLQASILTCFKLNETISSESICQTLRIDEKTLLQKINFWINEGVLKEIRENGILYFQRNKTIMKPQNVIEAQPEEGAEETGSSDLRHLEQFILGMLTNFDSLPLERIHNMLKMFAMDPPYDRSMDELSAFLTSLVNDGKIVVEGKNYMKSK